MEIIVFLSIVIAVVAVLTSIVLVRRVKKQIAEMTDVLVDVKNGNGNRRILSATNELTAPLAYEINEIVVAYESRLSTVRQTEETNRQLMLWLLPTPLTTFWSAGDMAAHGIKMDLEQMTGLIPSTFQVVFILGIMALVSFLLIDRLYKQRGE